MLNPYKKQTLQRYTMLLFIHTKDKFDTSCCPQGQFMLKIDLTTKCLFFYLFFSSPEPLGSQGELIGWP